jgi:hypothetical protein
MTKRHNSMLAMMGLFSLIVTAFVLFRATEAHAQGPYPVMDDVATKIVAKYQAASCEQLWERKSAHAAPTMEETRLLTFLRDDQNMRAAFIKKVAPPIANKMFDCGLIP